MSDLKPPKLMNIELVWLNPHETYGQEPFPYQPWRFKAYMKVKPKLHSDPTTQSPYLYNGLDVAVNDYVTTQPARALKIIEIIWADEDEVECIVEDDYRLNSKIDQNQAGESAIETGHGILFQVVDGLPILYPNEGLLGLTTADLIEIQSRFFYARQMDQNALRNLDLSNAEDGSVLVFNESLNTWVATKHLYQQVFDGGEY